MKTERIVFLDWLRVTACLMVLVTHCTEPFYLGGDGTYLASGVDYLWCTLINSFVRSCVPLFVLASSYLLFPLKTDTASFFRRRLVRIGIPLAVWLVIYALASPSPCTNLTRDIFNFCDPAGHLWFVYMLIGVYLLMPLLSPWAEKAGRKELRVFLGLWLFTTTIPFIRQLSTALFGTPELWGEANWTEFGTFYYVSGFIGYLILGYYIRREVPELSWKKTLGIAVPTFLTGYLITAGWFGTSLHMSFPGYDGTDLSYPVNHDISLAVNMETSWRYCTPGVVLMTVGLFLIIRKIKNDGTFYRRIVLPVSKASYGIYLMHIVFLLQIHGWLRPIFEAAFTPALATPLCILSTAAVTYVVCSIAAVLLQKIPHIGKYLAG